jgi:hypothetical protein
LWQVLLSSAGIYMTVYYFIHDKPGFATGMLLATVLGFVFNTLFDAIAWNVGWRHNLW